MISVFGFSTNVPIRSNIDHQPIEFLRANCFSQSPRNLPISFSYLLLPQQLIAKYGGTGVKGKITLKHSVKIRSVEGENGNGEKPPPPARADWPFILMQKAPCVEASADR